MNVGERIRKCRKAIGYTQRELAEKSGVATVSVQQYERGVRQPRLEQLRRIASALGVEWADLVPEEQQGQAVVDYMTEKLKTAGPFKKLSTEEAYRLGILSLTFNSDEDRIAYFYSCLNTDGKLAASKCFYQHLDKGHIREVTDYVESLAKTPQYQRPAPPQNTPTQQEGPEIAPSSDVPETSPEGE